MQSYFENNEELLFQNGVFTTLTKKNEKLEFWQDHLQRIQHSCDVFFGVKNSEKINFRVNELLKKLPAGNLRIKISIFPKASKLLFSHQAMHEADLSMAIFWQDLTAPSRLNLKLKLLLSNLSVNNLNCKIENYAEVFHLRRKAIDEGYDDLLFTNNDGVLLRGSTSNFFLIKGRELVTPDFGRLKQLEGITLAHIKNCMKEDYQLVTRNVDYALIKKSEGIFLTNSVYGLMHVQSVENFQFKNISMYEQLSIKWEQYKRENNK